MALMNRRRSIASIALGLLVSTGTAALDVSVVGLFPSKAVVQIDGGSLRTLSVGQKARDDVILLSVTRDSATFDIQGRRVELGVVSARRQARTAVEANYAEVQTNERGELVADGEVNGKPVRFIVDTGATLITLPAREASRLGLDYQSGQKTMIATANGEVAAYRLKLATVRVGEMSVHDVDAVIAESNSLPIALLGMSFLNRVDFKREGKIMTLTKR
ncbi:MAG: TIGR02281 family clan AA aspartic protease [Betaproteobacteria bacterium]